MAKATAFGALILWPDDTGNRRRDMRMPTGSLVVAEPSHGPAILCRIKDVGEGGVCVEWHAAPVELDDRIKLVFERRERDTVRTIELDSVVKWYSPRFVGLAFADTRATEETR